MCVCVCVCVCWGKEEGLTGLENQTRGSRKAGISTESWRLRRTSREKSWRNIREREQPVQRLRGMDRFGEPEEQRKGQSGWRGVRHPLASLFWPCFSQLL